MPSVAAPWPLQGYLTPKKNTSTPGLDGRLMPGALWWSSGGGLGRCKDMSPPLLFHKTALCFQLLHFRHFIDTKGAGQGLRSGGERCSASKHGLKRLCGNAVSSRRGCVTTHVTGRVTWSRDQPSAPPPRIPAPFEQFQLVCGADSS